jgi:hypothetical protein
VHRFVLAAALALVLAGCGTQRGEESDPRRTEMAWIGQMSAWLHGFERDLERAEALRNAQLRGQRSHRRDYERAVGEVRACARRFDELVGPPPAARLRVPARLLRESCRAYATAETAGLRSFDGDPGDALVGASRALSRAAGLFLRGTADLESGFAWNRPLPRAGRETGGSRIEPHFSRVASEIARRPIEIRCWSNGDWRRVRDEFRVYNNVTLEPSGFVSDVDRGHVNLSPWVCAHLVDLAYAQARRNGSGGLDTADAVETLTHEAEHVAGPEGTEAETECYAMQDLRRAARLLGASASYADELASRQWREAYPRLTPEYRTPLCFDGGPLDADRTSSVWP